MNVYQKLNDAREEFHASKLKKTGHNKFARYYYFELGDFIVPALQIFKKHGLTSVISFDPEVASMRIVNTEKPDEYIVIKSPMSTAALKGCHEVQNLGAVETYIRRYLWVAALEIVEHDALDATTGSPVSGRAVKGVEKVITPAGGIGDDLPDEEKEFLNDLAMSVFNLCNNGKAKAAREMVLSNQLDDEQMTYMSRRLDATTRRLLKEAKEAN